MMASGRVFRGASQDDEFARDGVLVNPILTQDEITTLRAVYDLYPEQHSTAFSATILSRDLAYRRHVFDALRELFAPKVHALFEGYRIFMAGFLAKQPSAQGAMPLHQDLTLVAAASRPALSIWCPLIDVDATNGCVEVVYGSHELNHCPRAAGTPFAYPEIETTLHEYHLTPVPMRAGEGLFLHHGTFHCSPPNRSTSQRPVAAAVLAPNEAPLVYFYRDAGPPPRLEEYAVDEEFYLRHAFGVRPEGAKLIGTRLEEVDPLPSGRFAPLVAATA